MQASDSGTPQDINDIMQSDPFTKLVHASGLLGQALIHVHEYHELISLPPVKSIEARLDALYIIRALTSLLATFQREASTANPLSFGSLALYRR